MSGVFEQKPEDQLSLREKIAQLVFVRIGSNMRPVRTVEQDEERVAELLARCPVGGLLLFNGGPETKRVLERLQGRSAAPLLVGSDVERGVGQQVRGFTLFPHAGAFDRLGGESEAAVGDFARAVASESHEVGIHITFAPVADVNSNPRNPIINTRSFSRDTVRATRLTRAFVEAAESAGLRTTAKHFPGHGDTEKDSHDSLPTIDLPIEILRAREFVPFQAAVDAGCSLVMTAHVSYPAIDPSGEPATLSRVMMQQLLREEMGFGGVVCSDSLLMAGARDRFAREADMALAVLKAGVDLLLDLDDPVQVVDCLCECVASGKLAERRVDEALARVWALKKRVFANSRGEGIARTDTATVSSSALAAKVAAGAVEVVGESGASPLPFRPDASLVVILVKPFETPIEPPEQPLGVAVRERWGDARYFQLGPSADASQYAAAAEAARTAKQLLVSMIVRPAAWYAFGLKAEQASFVRSLVAARDDAVLASLGVPSALDDFPRAAIRICTYSDVPVSQQALVEFLLNKS